MSCIGGCPTLGQTNASPAGPATAILNATLAALLALGLFESIVSTGKGNINSWTAHTLGTIALLRLRGFQQFGEILGRRTCAHAAYNIRVSYINRAFEVPQALIGLEEGFYKAFNFPKAVRDHYSTMNKTYSIKAELKNGLTAELICRVTETDHEADVSFQGFSRPAGPVKAGLCRASQRIDRRALANTVVLHSAFIAAPLAMIARWLFGMPMLRLVLNESIWSGGTMYNGHREFIRPMVDSMVNLLVLDFAPKLNVEEGNCPLFSQIGSMHSITSGVHSEQPLLPN
ncbi:C6 zinc finger domain-containing protein [Fusarium napiforme]|uniref:C6 zinc finger domain-containing protein n=1 Tax=Fusarium napiforme TaxID=42672 RepID=A0A8H5NIC3_9HYPO|nr:C6 zinc finger domain-containing protein [Fusarium napiforme]